MNNPTPHPTQPTETREKDPASNPPRRQWTRVRVPLESSLYERINLQLAELSMHLGFEVTMTKFLHRLVIEHWEAQMERFRKLQTVLKGSRS